jgi:molybdate transport system ATP-binding protein
MLSVDITKKVGNFTLNVSFEAENDAIALFGASGCGKTMTLKAVAGIVRPDRGRIVLDGRVLFDSSKRINLSPQQRKTGLLFQNYALFPNMTVKENIAAALKRSRAPDKNKRLAELMESFYLTAQMNHYPAQLSGGQQQRAALARILASDPALIMLDEPLSALDSYLRWQLEQELIDVIEQFPGTVLYVSHNRDEVYRICKKICVIHNGRSEAVADTQDFFEQPKTFAAALLSGCKNFSRAKKIAKNKVYAIDWNCELECGAVPDDIQYVGVRAHYLSQKQNQNRITCTIKKVIQDVFETIVIAAPVGTQQAADNEPVYQTRFHAAEQKSIRLEMSKSEADGMRAGDTIEAGIAPKDILPLR